MQPQGTPVLGYERGTRGPFPSIILNRHLTIILQYHLAQNKASTACDFDGDGQTQTAATATGSCATLMKEAGGVQGTGTVTSAPSSSGSGSGSAAIVAPGVQIGALKIGIAMIAAVFGGAAMIVV